MENLSILFLYLASINKNAARDLILFNILNNNNINVNIVDINNETPLMLFCKKCDAEFIDIILSNVNFKVDFDIRSNTGKTAFMYLCDNFDVNHKQIMKIANYKIKDINNAFVRNLCHNLDSFNKYQFIIYLLDNGIIDINEQDYSGNNLSMNLICDLLYKKEYNRMIMSKIIPISDCNILNNNNKNALMLACETNIDSNYIILLIKSHRTNLDQIDNNGNNFIDIAINNKYSDISVILKYYWNSLVKDKKCPNKILLNLIEKHSKELNCIRSVLDCYKEYQYNMPKIDFSYKDNICELFIDNLIYMNKSMINMIIFQYIRNKLKLSQSSFTKLLTLFFNKSNYNIVTYYDIMNLDKRMISNDDINKKIYKKYQSNYKLYGKIVRRYISRRYNDMYYKPNNIAYLCLNINFEMKIGIFNYDDKHHDKIKILFDVKDKYDLINKIKFYL